MALNVSVVFGTLLKSMSLSVVKDTEVGWPLMTWMLMGLSTSVSRPSPPNIESGVMAGWLPTTEMNGNWKTLLPVPP